MRFKPITLGAVLVIALCGATQPADEPNEAAGASSSEAATAPAASPSPEAAESPDVVAEEPVAASAEAPAEAAASSDEAAAPAPEIAVPAKGEPPTKEFLVGVWAEPGKSCETAIDFKADGTMIGPFPRWELSEDGELTMVGNRQKIKLIVIDANTMQSRRAPTAAPRTLKRCGGG